MKTKLVKLSICPCGFNVLKDEITVGTEYEVNNDRRTVLTFVCGGCGEHIPCNCVWVENSATGKEGYIPAAIFGL